MSIGGFMAQVYSPAPRFVGETSLALIPEGDRAALYEAMRRQLLPVPEASEFTVALPGFVPTTVEFKSLRTAAMVMLGRARDNAPLPNLVGAAFIFAGKSKADDEEAIRRTAMGRDSLGEPYPIPASIYDRIRDEPIRPLLAMALWKVETSNDPSPLPSQPVNETKQCARTRSSTSRCGSPKRGGCWGTKGRSKATHADAREARQQCLAFASRHERSMEFFGRFD